MLTNAIKEEILNKLLFDEEQDEEEAAQMSQVCLYYCDDDMSTYIRQIIIVRVHTFAIVYCLYI